MSSKGGPRATGTDGSDFHHREQVASQYKLSVQLKSRIRVCLLFNVATVLVQFLAFLGIRSGLVESASELALNQWQYIWMLSGVVSLLGLSALSKNKAMLLNLHNLGMMFFGFGSVAFGSLAQYSAYQHHQFRGVTRTIGDVPVYYVWAFVIGVNFINYVATYFYSLRLQAAWSVKKSR